MLTEKDFITAIREHEHILHKVCNMYMHNRNDREDLFQEIVLNAWKGIKQFRQEAKFSTWLYRVALNTAITMFKKDRKHAVLQRQPEYVSFHEDTSDQDHYVALRKAVDELSAVEKALVMLYFEGYSHQEMAIITGITVNNVAVRMNRIKTRLKESTKKFL